MNDKQSADYIYSFFANLTKDYPEVKSEWLINQCSDDLPLITIEEVEKKLRKVDISKSTLAIRLTYENSKDLCQMVCNPFS